VSRLNKKIIQRKVCCSNRVIDLIKSIPDLFVEPTEINFNQEYCIFFGKKDGVVVYNYCTSKKFIIGEILKELKEFGIEF